jgi:hypothetical protein
MFSEKCASCDVEFDTEDGLACLCDRCDDIERAWMRTGPGDYPLTRTEQMRERLGVSGNVDE